ncbi:phytoene desaturase [Ginsengibacter hankyongi]|uniref:Phytoene desaturase n=1 Tax=Ginsengibacter hankyongi TaxID=2607284 RepID=A0A5J5IN99_9BACT|nr:phytoene desaturase family protein [Ginsengibacter hankyongi]KAA9041803.1 phytoene desaturase [Ginsengibacter hankyongi]
MKKAIIIGSGFSGISTASFLAKNGWDVTVIEKHNMPGGRARQLKDEGFVFDMGPSWYWMPGVFERYFQCFGKKRSEYYSLKRLDPSYKIFWKDEAFEIPADYEELKNLFEKIEKGSSEKLNQYLEQAAYKFEVGINKLVQKPGQSLREFLDWDLIKGVWKLDVFSSIQSHVRKYFKSEKLRQLLEFPVLFLGALPKDIPALYSLMNFADIKGGTWYPENGMYSIVNEMYVLAKELGVKFKFNENVTAINTKANCAIGITSELYDNGQTIIKNYNSDVIVATADYHFVETKLLPAKLRSYKESYWNKKVLAPGCLLYYVGLNKKLKNITHHSLFFDVDFEKHGTEIYITKKWPSEPLFYVCTPSVTDKSVAPDGCENLFFLIPVAAGLPGDTETLREEYFKKIIKRFEKYIGEEVTNYIVYKKTFGPEEFVNEYNAFKGNAYGLANTLMQTAVLKPSCRSKKVKNLFYAGQLTVPGPGVPPSLISGEVVAKEVVKHFNS